MKAVGIPCTPKLSSSSKIDPQPKITKTVGNFQASAIETPFAVVKEATLVGQQCDGYSRGPALVIAQLHKVVLTF